MMSLFRKLSLKSPLVSVLLNILILSIIFAVAILSGLIEFNPRREILVILFTGIGSGLAIHYFTKIQEKKSG